ncbi:MAG: hypothetical protein BAA02_00110 [Paenibacillaceae bacterium ZCTH02-B3]|nr:MAG: hypothetical protein BAA02_00110 [Paenibacillaceae bacterium ZCTH02-B3]
MFPGLLPIAVAYALPPGLFVLSLPGETKDAALYGPAATVQCCRTEPEICMAEKFFDPALSAVVRNPAVMG